jgi:hypothetical protein
MIWHSAQSILRKQHESRLFPCKDRKRQGLRRRCIPGPTTVRPIKAIIG